MRRHESKPSTPKRGRALPLRGAAFTGATRSPTLNEASHFTLHLKGLTFDMSGNRRRAKHAGGCPLDGVVRFHCNHEQSRLKRFLIASASCFGSFVSSAHKVKLPTIRRCVLSMYVQSTMCALGNE